MTGRLTFWVCAAAATALIIFWSLSVKERTNYPEQYRASPTWEEIK